MADAVASASSTAVRRLRHDLESLRRSQNPQIDVQPSEDNMLEWHFVLHTLPSDTPYAAGCYHGKIVFPAGYPMAPPALLMVTPSGRLQVGQRLCLSMTDFHPESWNPAWSVETILVGLLSFFVSDGKGYGAISASDSQRRRLAEGSWAWNAANQEFRALFPDFAARTELHTQEQPRGPAGLNTTDVDEAESPQQQQLQLPSTGAPVPQQCHHATGAEGDTPAGAQQSLVANEDDDEAPVECWICRDTGVDEPLIQPCACRGSMSGVHASCVEQWVNRHRRNAVDDEMPRCSVCHQPYQGYEWRPGFRDFAVRQFYVCFRFACVVLLRCILLWILLIAYETVAAASEGDSSTKIPLGVRIAVMVIFSLAASHKLLLLTVSLPPHQPPPRHRFLQLLFIADQQSLSLHIAEAFACAMMLTFWYLTDAISLPFFLPFAVACLLPVGKIMYHRNPSFACIGRGFFAILVSPFVVIWVLLRLVWRYPQRAIHPLDAGPHIFVAIASVTVCLACESNVPAVALWASHTALVSGGIVEVLLVKRLRWREGPLWSIALQVTLLSSYTANTLCQFPEGIGSPDRTSAVVLAASLVWLLIVAVLTFSVNWEILVQHYRRWQARHGNFRLENADASQGQGGGPSVVDATVPSGAAS